MANGRHSARQRSRSRCPERHCGRSRGTCLARKRGDTKLRTPLAAAATSVSVPLATAVVDVAAPAVAESSPPAPKKGKSEAADTCTVTKRRRGKKRGKGSNGSLADQEERKAFMEAYASVVMQHLQQKREASDLKIMEYNEKINPWV